MAECMRPWARDVTTVSSGQTLIIASGTTTSTTVLSGGTEIVSATGTQ
jgi:autotransporter passenger strand-loop-strand repeat protein